jgi:hypothetical protein
MKIKQITETTTAGAIATVDSPLGGTQSRGNPSIYGGKKVGSLFKGKKTKAPYVNSINESAELSEADLSEQDLIVVPGQGRKSKTGFVPHGESRLDHEVEMARSDLFQAAKNAKQVYSIIKDVGEDEGLEGWVQEKIIKANDYLNTVREYLEGKQTQGVTENNQRGDSLVTDALKIMRGAEVSDAVRALTTVLGNREYNSRRGFYNFYIKQMIDMYRQQGLAEGLGKDIKRLATGKDVKSRAGQEIAKSQDASMKGDTKTSKKHFDRFDKLDKLANKEQGVAEGEDEGIRPQGKILKRLRDIAIMSPTLTFQNFRQSGKEAIITDAMMACKIMKRHFLQNKNQPTAQFIYNLENEIYDFMRGRKLDTPDGNSYTMDLSDLSKGTLGKMQFQTKEAVAEGKRNLKCVCKTQGTMQCPVHTPKDLDVLENNKDKKA